MDTLILEVLHKSPETYIFSLCCIWNLIVFLLYGADKIKSKTKSHRISEKTLLMCAFVFGGLGALSGMCLFRHKTKHMKFVILVPLFAALNIAVWLGLLWYL